ncbi:MAG: TonB-dependent receptor plug domain-containing protein [Fidelibacterota bacterium]
MVRIIKIILIIVPVSFLVAFQTVSGIIVDEKGLFVRYATVRHIESDSWAIADEEGIFSLQTKLSIGDTLVISRIGFSTAYHAITNQTSQEIVLSKKVLVLDPVQVMGNKPIANGGLNKITQAEMDPFSRKNALNRLPGSMIRTYGGLAGVTTVSMDGGEAVHTKVVLDGIDLTNAQNGLTDLSDIPLALMHNLFLGRSPNVYYGSGSFDGVIHIRTLFTQSYINFGSGSFGYQNGAGGYSHSTSNTHIQLQFGLTSSEGDYPYTTVDSTSIRSNNDYEQQFISGHYQYTNSNRIIKGSILATDHNRGVAGSLSWPSPNARRKNNLILTGLEFIQILENGHLRFQAYHRTSDEKFKDSSIGTDSQHKVGTDGAKILGQYQLNKVIGVDGFVAAKFESIESTDVGDRERDTKAYGLQALIQPINSIFIKPGIRADIIDKTQETSFEVETTLDLNKIGKFTAIIGTGFHVPSFNDLYWPSDPYSKGNPDLEPENSEFQIIRWNNTFGKHLNYAIEYRERKSQNLIVWAADENYIWKPQNLDKSDRKNLIISASIPASISGLTISGSVTRTLAKDITTGKALQYIPESSANIMVSYILGDIQLELQSKYVGERSYQVYDNNYEKVDKILKSFQDINAGVHFTLPILNQSLRIHLIAENILDKNTAFFPDYPEPGRSMKMGITINL